MFQNRRNSQKPDEELYAAFKQSFPDVGPGTSAGSAQPGPAHRSTSLSQAIPDAAASNRYAPHCLIHLHTPSSLHASPSDHTTMKPTYEPVEPDEDDVLTMDYFGRPLSDLEGAKDPNETPKALSDAWRLTPSLMDPNSYAFNALFNQPPGYYTPTPGGINTLYHSQAGDLHTPGMGMNTPLSLPHSVHPVPAQDAPLDLQHFQPHLLQHPQQFQNPFLQQTTYAPPSHFLQHQDSGYVAMDSSSHKTTPTSIDGAMRPPSSAQAVTQAINTFMQMPPPMPSGARLVSSILPPTK